VLASRAHAEAQAVFTTAHNTPFGDIVDSEDDLMPVVFRAFEDASRTLELLAASLQTAAFDRELMARRAGARFLTVTELADTLVRVQGLSFREAHSIVAAAVKSGDDSHSRIVDDVLSRLGATAAASRDELLRALDPVAFVEVRAIPGGPAPREVARRLGDFDESLHVLDGWTSDRSRRLKECRSVLYEAVAAHRTLIS
jgi:argininosuccinate lyase